MRIQDVFEYQQMYIELSTKFFDQRDIAQTLDVHPGDTVYIVLIREQLVYGADYFLFIFISTVVNRRDSRIGVQHLADMDQGTRR